MAKVSGPLMSMTASGQLGKTLVFLKTGVVRNYVIPANPQTVDQVAWRNVYRDLQAELKLMGATLRAELKIAFGPRWNSMIIGELTNGNGASYTVYAAEFDAFISGNKTAWAGVDVVTPIVKIDGELLYAVTSAIYDMAARLGATVTLDLPATGNSSTVEGQFYGA